MEEQHNLLLINKVRRRVIIDGIIVEYNFVKGGHENVIHNKSSH